MPTVVPHPAGGQIEFFDGVDPAVQQQALRQMGALAPPTDQQHMQRPAASPVAGALMQFAQQFVDPPVSVPIPVAPGNTFGLKPQDLQQVYGNINESNKLNASEKIRQRVDREKAMEAEKDRAQQFKMEETRQKNDMARIERDYRRQLDALDAKQRAGNAVETNDGIVWVWKDEEGQQQAKLIYESSQDSETKYTYDRPRGQVISYGPNSASAIDVPGLNETPTTEKTPPRPGTPFDFTAQDGTVHIGNQEFVDGKGWIVVDRGPKPQESQRRSPQEMDIYDPITGKTYRGFAIPGQGSGYGFQPIGEAPPRAATTQQRPMSENELATLRFKVIEKLANEDERWDAADEPTRNRMVEEEMARLLARPGEQAQQQGVSPALPSAAPPGSRPATYNGQPGKVSPDGKTFYPDGE